MLCQSLLLGLADGVPNCRSFGYCRFNRTYGNHLPTPKLNVVKALGQSGRLFEPDVGEEVVVTVHIFVGVFNVVGQQVKQVVVHIGWTRTHSRRGKDSTG